MPGDLPLPILRFPTGLPRRRNCRFLARCAGMTHLAISDHDSIAGVR